MSYIRDLLFGLAVGDALGVPVEFLSRSEIATDPVKSMRGEGTHHQPAGTWSDDSSLAFCTAEALVSGYDLEKIAANFVRFQYNAFWTPYGEVFDEGITTQRAIARLLAGTQPDLAGGFEESDNGNGSLMRILPLLQNIMDLPVDERYRRTKAVSSLTHGHARSVLACFYYLEFARCLALKMNARQAYEEAGRALRHLDMDPSEIARFDRLTISDMEKTPESDIHSTGYVVHTLEAAIWCLLTTHTFKEAVLRAVNLGDDTDTTGAVTGGLAGILYGVDTIPKEWIDALARKTDIDKLAQDLESATPRPLPNPPR